MRKLFELLFYGHEHKWKIVSERDVTGQAWHGRAGVIGTRFTLQCSICGNIKTVEQRGRI